MRVSEIQIVDRDDGCQLQARVESDRALDDGDRFRSFTLWYRFPAWCRPYLSPDNGDPFLAALLFPAMMTGERLVIPASVSPTLLRHLVDIQSIYVSFDHRLAPIAVEATPRDTSPRQEPPAAAGLFFSLGVDSFYSLLKNLRDHPADDETVSHLITIHGFDISHREWSEQFRADMLQNCERVARETGKILLPVVTNVRPITRSISRWDMSHGGVLASVALALAGLLSRVLIAASTTYDQLYPWGSHPALDPLWSTEQLTVVHDGCEMNRIDKVRFLAESPLVLETLKVCPYYNCGQCIKCLPTMIDLLQTGALERSVTFPKEIDVERLRRVFRTYKGQLNVENYERRLADLDDDKSPPGLRAALAEFIASETTPPEPRPETRRGKRSLVGRLFPRSSG